MNAVRVVLLVELVCIFTPTGETDSFNLTCEDVSGHVGEELTLTCSVSGQRDTCCVKMYKFMNTADDDTTICKGLKNNTCPRRMNLTCPYTANSNMTTPFKFFLQTTCGPKTVELTVNITVGFSITCRNVTGRVGKESTLNCDVSYPDKTCCMMMFKIINTPDTTVYREEYRKDPCLQFTSFPCPYTANEVMTSTFKFILHTRCGNKTAGFTVNITDSFNLTCEDVSGHVGEELTLTCSVSGQRDTCCVKMYKFMNTADDDTTICKGLKNNTCPRRMNLTCPYTANSNMTTPFKFFLQTTCGPKTVELTVNITETFIAVTVPVVVFLIVIGIILKKKCNFTFNTCGFQRDFNKVGFSITCRNVTGRVGKESTLNCDVSYPDKTCCMMMFKIINTPDTTVYTEEYRKDPCLQFTSFPCPYTANEVMTSTFKFILHTRCGNKTAGFTVNITDFSYVACKDVTGHVGQELTLDCTVNYSERCHAVLYKFINKDKDTTIFRKNCSSNSNQEHFTCSYTPNEDMTTTFLFFLQADCGTVEKYFTVNPADTERLKSERFDIGRQCHLYALAKLDFVPPKIQQTCTATYGLHISSSIYDTYNIIVQAYVKSHTDSPKSLACAVSSMGETFIAVTVPVVVFLIVIGIILKKKYNFTFNTCGFQRDFIKDSCAADVCGHCQMFLIVMKTVVVWREKNSRSLKSNCHVVVCARLKVFGNPDVRVTLHFGNAVKH
ncbi:hypothetical protein E1301_Tti023980 [Triplophysa tibetana]|uniref:Ig-like domain-containing protein n=1 Tax=Triplophysa tibetana TaxID=1572043 RepID=A0A5A9PWG9_9TELE|nr:hypothetical protein E1301_Tti023980 [Triplophysa tibetana]